MTPEVFNQSLESLTVRKPFRPFTIEMKDGTRFVISEPGSILYRDGKFLPAKGAGLTLLDVAAIAQIFDFVGGPGSDTTAMRNDLANRWRQRPFVPFRLIVSEGPAHDIRRPEQIIVARDAVTIGIPSDSDEFWETTAMVDLFHVVRLEPLPIKTKVASPDN